MLNLGGMCRLFRAVCVFFLFLFFLVDSVLLYAVAGWVGGVREKQQQQQQAGRQGVFFK